MDDNKALPRTPKIHTRKVTMPHDLAIEAMQDVLNLANETITDIKYVIAISMALEALMQEPEKADQLATVEAERDLWKARFETEERAHDIANEDFLRVAVERDAAMAEIPHNCYTCKYKPTELKGGVGVCGMGCTVSSISIEHAERCKWEWRGPQRAGEGGE